MINIIKNFCNAAINLTENKDISEFKLSKEEMLLLLEIMTNLENLTCYAENKPFHDAEVASEIINNSMVCISIDFIGSSAYNFLVNKSEKLKKFMESNETISQPILEMDDYSNSMIIYDIYKKEGNFLYKYQSLKESDKIFGVGTYTIPLSKKSHVNAKLKNVPIFIKKNAISEYEHMLTKKEDKYLLPAFPFFELSPFALAKKVDPKNHNLIQKASIIERGYASCAYSLIEKNGDLIEEKFYNSFNYDNYYHEKQYYNKFVFINKNGEILDNSSVSPSLIMKKIRHNIAHSKNMYSFKINERTAQVSFYAYAFILDDRAIIVPYFLYESLSHINMTNFDVDSNTYNYLKVANLEKQLNSEEEILNYLKKCKNISLSNVKGINREKLDCTLTHFINKYEEITEKELSLQDYLSQNIKEIFKNVNVKVSELKNSEFVANKLARNPYFLKSIEGLEEKYQALNILVILKDFYDFDLNQNDSLSNSGKAKNFKINPKSVNRILPRIYHFMAHNLFDIEEDNDLAMIREEVYFSLCIFLAFANFIWNKFNDDLEKEMPFFESLKSKLEASIFKGFSLIDEKNKSSKRITTSKEMQDVIDKIRNNVAHNNVKVKFSKSGNPEDNFLIFSFHNRDTSYYMISVKDFLTFITNPLFCSYSKNKQEIVSVNSFEEIIQEVVKKIN